MFVVVCEKRLQISLYMKPAETSGIIFMGSEYITLTSRDGVLVQQTLISPPINHGKICQQPANGHESPVV